MNAEIKEIALFEYLREQIDKFLNLKNVLSFFCSSNQSDSLGEIKKMNF